MAATQQPTKSIHIKQEFAWKDWAAIEAECGTDLGLIAKKLKTPAKAYIHLIIVRPKVSNMGHPRRCQKLTKATQQPHNKGAAFYVEIDGVKYNICKTCYGKKNKAFRADEFSPDELIKHNEAGEYPILAPTEVFLTPEQKILYDETLAKIEAKKVETKDAITDLAREKAKLKSQKARNELNNAIELAKNPAKIVDFLESAKDSQEGVADSQDSTESIDSTETTTDESVAESVPEPESAESAVLDAVPINIPSPVQAQTQKKPAQQAQKQQVQKVQAQSQNNKPAARTQAKAGGKK